MNNTLDFRAMKQVEELNKKGYYIACDMDILERFMFKYTRISKILTLMGVCFIIWCVTIYGGITTVSANYEEDYSYIIGCVNAGTHETRKPIEGGANGFAKCYYGAGWQNITLNDEVLRYYRELKIPTTRALDLLSISSNECSQKHGLCHRNNSDIGPFQINFIHSRQYKNSKKIMDLVGKRPFVIEALYKYQMIWTKRRMDNYEKIGACDTYINKDRFLCQAVRHNGNKKIDINGKEHRFNYANKGWEVRKYISNYLVEIDFIK